MNIEIKDGLVLASKIVICILAIILVYFIGLYARRNIPLFEIKEVYVKSTANANHLDDNMSQNWNLNIYQTNDIFIKFGHIDNIYTFDENDKLLKNVYVDNILVLEEPILGEEISVYSISNDSSEKFKYTEEYLVNDSVRYIVLPNNASIYNLEVNNTYGQIALSFVNHNVLNYIYENVEELTFDGTLLQNANVKLEEIQFIVSFDLTFITETDKKYVYNIKVKLPYGNILEKGTVITDDMSNLEVNVLENKMEE